MYVSTLSRPPAFGFGMMTRGRRVFLKRSGGLSAVDTSGMTNEQFCATRPQWERVFNPLCWPGAISSTAADVYSRVQYGKVPAIAQLPLPPAPSAPQTLPQMSAPGAFTPDQAYMTPEEWAQFQADQRAALDAAVSSGAWNPAGNFSNPFSPISDFFSRYAGLLIGGTLAVGGVLLMGAGGRRR